VTVKTDANGEAKVRGFLGDYEVTAGDRSAKGTLTREGTLLTVP